MDTYIVFWLAATVVFVLVELMTVGLTSIWFAAGSFVAFIIALLGGNVVVQGIASLFFSNNTCWKLIFAIHFISPTRLNKILFFYCIIMHYPV